MILAQLNTRHFTFGRGLDLVGHVSGQTHKARQAGYGGNIAAGILEGSTLVSASIVCAANVAGAPRGWSEDLLSTFLFFMLSQAAFIVYTVVFDYFYIEASNGNPDGTITGAIHRRLPPEYMIPQPGRARRNCAHGNCAVALSYGATMISSSILLGGSVYQSYGVNLKYVLCNVLHRILYCPKLSRPIGVQSYLAGYCGQ